MANVGHRVKVQGGSPHNHWKKNTPEKNGVYHFVADSCESFASLSADAPEDVTNADVHTTSSRTTCYRCCSEREDNSAWLLLGRVFIFNFLTGINIGSFSLLYVEYTGYFQTSKGTVGWIVSIQLASLSLFGEYARVISPKMRIFY